MKRILWAILAFILSRRPIANAIIRRAKRTPYSHITGRTSDDVYMRRWWVFNPYTREADGTTRPARWQWLPSIRVHEILRADDDDHPHDHPWDARTIVLKGWYAEQRPMELGPHMEVYRERGYTGTIRVGLYHRITGVSRDGHYNHWRDRVPEDTCTTLFFTWGKAEEWGFWVGGRKVPWREYLYGEKP